MPLDAGLAVLAAGGLPALGLGLGLSGLAAAPWPCRPPARPLLALQGGGLVRRRPPRKLTRRTTPIILATGHTRLAPSSP